MKNSDSLVKIAPALVKLQAQVKPAKQSGFNSHLKMRYSTYKDCRDAWSKPLEDNGFSLIHSPAVIDGMVCVECMLLHESGEWVSCQMSCHSKDPYAQAIGSATTYLKRYSGDALIGGTSDDQDEDAQEAAPQQSEAGTSKLDMKGFVDIPDHINTFQIRDILKSQFQGHFNTDTRKWSVPANRVADLKRYLNTPEMPAQPKPDKTLAEEGIPF